MNETTLKIYAWQNEACFYVVFFDVSFYAVKSFQVHTKKHLQPSTAPYAALGNSKVHSAPAFSMKLSSMRNGGYNSVQILRTATILFRF